MSNVTPWLLFQTAQSVSGIGSPWTNPEYALTPDYFAEATAGPIGSVFPGQQTTPLRVTQPDLGSALPGSFILRGVEAEFVGRWFGGSTGLRTVPASSMVGASVRQSLGSLVLQVNTPTTIVKGSPTDLMGFIEQDVLEPNFGFQLYGTSNTSYYMGNTLHIDSIRARFYWDYAPSRVRARGRSRAAMVRRIGL